MVKTSVKGQVVIPLEIRRKIGLKPGDMVQVALVGGRKVTIEPVPEDPIEAACGMLRDGPSLTAALLAERKAERAYEEKKTSGLLRAGRLPGKGRRLRKG